MLLETLERVKGKARDGVVRSSEIARADRERLTRAGWLQPILRGWYLLSRPEAGEGNTTLWYSHFWDFIRYYLSELYGDGYTLSAESSLDLHTDATHIPAQVVAVVSRGGGKTIQLPFGTSLLPYSDPDAVPDDLEKVRGICTMPLPLALTRVSPTYFRSNQMQIEIALRTVDITALSRQLLSGGFRNAAERIAGAYQFMGEELSADRIRKDMQAAGFQVIPVNPFQREEPFLTPGMMVSSPAVARLEALWSGMRDDVIEVFPAAPGLPTIPDIYLQQIDEVITSDAYHSLSIEGYRVTPELIEKVRSGDWDPESSTDDREHQNALAAKGYLEAFKLVKEDVSSVIKHGPPDEIFEEHLHDWHRALFSAQVQANLIEPEQLAGYRNNQVYIAGSRHIPPHWHKVTDCMEVLFNLLKQEPESCVRAVLGHFLFAYIHPYTDGNGRLARFLMNLMLASDGYPWTVIRLEHRHLYMTTLEQASVSNQIRPFAQFILRELSVGQDD